jgi:hypothetical protein
MIWADGPARLVVPDKPWLHFLLDLSIVLIIVAVVSVVTLTIYTRARNGHWPWTYCPVCASNRRTEKARKDLAKRKRRKPRVWEDL